MALGSSQDSNIRVAPDSTGKKVDNAVLIRERDAGVAAETIYRQRVVLGADDNPRQQVTLRGEAGDVDLQVRDKKLDEIHHTLEEIRDMLRMVVGV